MHQNRVNAGMLQGHLEYTLALNLTETLEKNVVIICAIPRVMQLNASKMCATLDVCVPGSRRLSERKSRDKDQQKQQLPLDYTGKEKFRGGENLQIFMVKNMLKTFEP